MGCEIIVISLFTAGRHSVISKDARWSIFGAVTGPVTMMGEHFVSVYILAVYAPCRRGYRCAAAGAAMTYNPPPGPGARDKGFARVAWGRGREKGARDAITIRKRVQTSYILCVVLTAKFLLGNGGDWCARF